MWVHPASVCLKANIFMVKKECTHFSFSTPRTQTRSFGAAGHGGLYQKKHGEQKGLIGSGSQLIRTSRLWSLWKSSEIQNVRVLKSFECFSRIWIASPKWFTMEAFEKPLLGGTQHLAGPTPGLQHHLRQMPTITTQHRQGTGSPSQ